MSWRSAALVLVVVGLAVGGWLLVRWLDGNRDAPLPPPGALPAGAQRVTVTRVVDGDSLEVQAPAPGPVVATTDRARVRLLGIDAPEMHGVDDRPQCYARDARRALDRLAPLGAPLWLTADREPLDRHGRHLVYAWTADGRFVNADLLAAGDARLLVVGRNDRYAQAFGELAGAARTARRGLWATCVPAPTG